MSSLLRPEELLVITGGVTPGTTSNYLCGDWLETNITDVHNNGVETSQLVRVICGVCVGDLENSGVILPDEQFETDENKRKNQVHFLLVRYAQKHPLSRGPRGPQHRPTCPGLLKDTHCLGNGPNDYLHTVVDVWKDPRGR